MLGSELWVLAMSCGFEAVGDGVMSTEFDLCWNEGTGLMY